MKSSLRRIPGLTPALCAMSATALLALPATALAETCPNEEFRTGAGANLPDCRAYELVTPPFKEAAAAPLVGNSVIHGFAGMSVDGSHVVVNSVGNFGDAHASLGLNNYELTRTESGWSETNIDLPESLFPASLPLQATPDFGAFLYEARATEQSVNAKDFWVGEGDGALHDLGPFLPPSSTAGPPGHGSEFGSITSASAGIFSGASMDLSHVVFDTSTVTKLHPTGTTVSWPGDGSGNLYEYTAGQGGPPVLVGVDSSGDPCPAEYDGMSADGSTVFFTCGEVFARVDESRTVAITEPSAADCSACASSEGGEFVAASADGSKVFFTTSQPLLGSDTSENIYEYDFDAPSAGPGDPDGRIVQVSGGEWGPGGAQVQEEVESQSPAASVRVSEDGSHVYFIAKGALSGAMNNLGQSPIEGGRNLYVFERDARFPGGRLSFIATLSSSDTAEFNPGEFDIRSEGYDYKREGATVTPDGGFLVFTSHADLTPDDTSTARQVFEYDAQTGDLVRVSIGQNGFNDDGNTDTFDAGIPPQEHDMPLAVSNDGAFVVFQSADGLTSGALNGFRSEVTGIYANNVYEYRDGEVYLISDGQDTNTVEGHSVVSVNGVSPSGQDIFFETADRLVPQDLDTETDVYDARIDGGFPAPVSLLPSCSGDACQGQLSPSPVLLSPGSEFQAGGNPPLAVTAPTTKPMIPKAKPATCRKDYVKKKSKCVKAKSKKKARKSSRDRRASR